jgi:biopolymer transport protein ExbD
MAGSVGSDDGDFGFQIAPMVDVVFVLMLFFMACAGVQISEVQLSINLPSEGGTGPSVEKPPQIIEINENGQILTNKRQFDSPTSKDLPELTQFLTDYLTQFGPDEPVIIRPARQAKHERIMDVLNAAAKARVKNLSFG